MKVWRDMRGPRLMPTDNLHASRSSPNLKALSTVYLYPAGANASGLPSSSPLHKASHTHSEGYIHNPSARLESCSSIPASELVPKVMGRHRSDTISPLSHDSIDDLIQSRPDSPVTEQVPGIMQVDFKWKTSKKILHIDVLESSQDEPLNTFLPLSQSTNAASTFPPIQTVTSNHPVIVVPNTPPQTYDGPSSVATVTTVAKDFSHSTADCPTISEAIDLKYDTECANVAPGRNRSIGRVPLSAFDNVPAVDERSKPELPALAQSLKPPEIPTAAAIPGLPLDITGLEPIPPTPKPNVGKNAKFKIGVQKSIRKSRRIVMRKPVLSVLLGRQVAGATAASLKIVSRGGSILSDAVQGAVPEPVPMPR